MYPTHWYRYLSVILGGLTLGILVLNLQLVREPSGTLAVQCLANLQDGKFGTGMSSGRGNHLDFSQLLPGDILLGGNPRASYGVFTHAGIYLGDGMVLDGWLDQGLARTPVETFHGYDWACILRVKLPPEARRRAVDYALAHEHRIFYPIAFKPGERIWNCTKVVWKSYLLQGVDLDTFHDLWVAPDAFYLSPHVEVIAEDGRQN